jgi:hypothetical protein
MSRWHDLLGPVVPFVPAPTARMGAGRVEMLEVILDDQLVPVVPPVPRAGAGAREEVSVSKEAGEVSKVRDIKNLERKKESQNYVLRDNRDKRDTAGEISPPSGQPGQPGQQLRRAARIAGAQRFADSPMHDEAVALGWTWGELYDRDTGAAMMLGNDRVLYVTSKLISACSPQGEGRPIYKGVSN